MRGSRSLHVLVLVGGRSAEHPISLRSGATVVDALASTGHRITVVGITREGIWVHGDLSDQLQAARSAILELDGRGMRRVTVAWDGTACRLFALDGSDLGDSAVPIDVVFPMLHGPNGEDGTMQGLLELARVPYVGAGTTASALAMDKLAMKTLCAGAGLAQVEFFAAGSDDTDTVDQRVRESFGYPCYVKPANLGSSVGVSRAQDRDELAGALQEARKYDDRVLVERAVDAREIEIAVLGSQPAELSPVGEILPADGFYDFESKYVDATAGLRAPTEVTPAALQEIHRITRTAWELIGGRGMARVDFFVERGTGAVLLNEINTIPGFTQISMYPRLWAAAGVPLTELVERLLALAMEKR